MSIEHEEEEEQNEDEEEYTDEEMDEEEEEDEEDQWDEEDVESTRKYIFEYLEKAAQPIQFKYVFDNYVRTFKYYVFGTRSSLLAAW